MTPFLAYFTAISAVSLFTKLDKEGEESCVSISGYIKLLIFTYLNYYFLSLTPFFDSGLPSIIWSCIAGIALVFYPIAIWTNKPVENSDYFSQVTTRIVCFLFSLALYGWGGAF